MFIRVSNPEITFELNICNKINIVVGNSSSHKSELCSVLDNMYRAEDGLTICNIENIRFIDEYYDDKSYGYVYVVDEDSLALREQKFKDFIINSDNIFIIILRDDMVYGKTYLKGLDFGIGDVLCFYEDCNDKSLVKSKKYIDSSDH